MGSNDRTTPFYSIISFTARFSINLQQLHFQKKKLALIAGCKGNENGQVGDLKFYSIL